MPPKKRAIITHDLIVTSASEESAAPAVVQPVTTPRKRPQAPAASRRPKAVPAAPSRPVTDAIPDKRVTVTVRLDATRRKRAFRFCVEVERKLQPLWMEALAAYLDAWPKVPEPATDKPRGTADTYPIAVRFARPEHRRFALFATEQDRTHQDILIDALDMYLDQHEA